MKLEMRNKDDCTFDMISLGEIMLRFDPGDSRIRTARSFREIGRASCRERV